MTSTFVVVPQWQGSGSSRAMRLVDGAEAIRGDLPSAHTRTVDVPLEAGDERGTGLARYGSLLLVKERTLEVLSDVTDVPIVIGGDCGVELAAVEHATASGDVAVVWFDAHPDLNTAESSTTGAFTGMVLRALLGDGPLGSATPLDPAKVVLAGARMIDDGEHEFLAESHIASVDVSDLDTPDALVSALRATGATSVYLHIDVDILDPAEFSGKGDPVPFGITPAQLVSLIKAIRTEFTLVGAGITEFAPASPEAATDDLPTILRVIGALTSS
jgi:arginase